MVRVRYVHADQYVSDVVKAYQRKAFDEFKRYYHSLDLLLIDDIQFFSGKSATQEQFFYAFEVKQAQRKQIIITSDTYPKELAGIDTRLISRFDSGLTVAIEPPEPGNAGCHSVAQGGVRGTGHARGGGLLHCRAPAQQSRARA